MSKSETVLFTQADIQRTIKRLTHEIIESNKGCKDLALVGIITRGEFIACRIAHFIKEFENIEIPVGVLDVTLYRDDIKQNINKKATSRSQIDFDVNDKTIILVDDVINSGRTTRAALDALNDYGRPSKVQLLSLLDRGHRELPIAADFVGKNVPTSPRERINVKLVEYDEIDEVTLSRI